MFMLHLFFSLCRIKTTIADPIGTCRMNRRKADFKFAYKFLEDDV